MELWSRGEGDLLRPTPEHATSKAPCDDLCSLCSFARSMIPDQARLSPNGTPGVSLDVRRIPTPKTTGRSPISVAPRVATWAYTPSSPRGISSGDAIAQSELFQSQPCTSRRASEQHNRAERYGNLSVGGRGQVGPKSSFGRPSPSAADTGNTRAAKPFATKVCRKAHRGVVGLVSRSRSRPSSQCRPEACHLAFARSLAACRGGGKGRRHRLLGRGHAEPETASGPMRWLTGNSHRGFRRTREGCVGGRRR
jgi:hypothetical protein